MKSSFTSSPDLYISKYIGCPKKAECVNDIRIIYSIQNNKEFVKMICNVNFPMVPLFWATCMKTKIFEIAYIAYINYLSHVVGCIFLIPRMAHGSLRSYLQYINYWLL